MHLMHLGEIALSVECSFIENAIILSEMFI